MSSILLGWELGAGHGHVRTLLTLARAFAAAGHSPVFAVRDPVDVWPVLRGTGFPVVPAPAWPSRRARFDAPLRARTFADIPAFLGWSEPAELEGMLRAWDGLLDLVRPALVVVDHAPGLALAAAGRVPLVGVGTGFSNPPAEPGQFRVLDPEARGLGLERELLASIQEVLRRRGQSVPATLTEGLASGRRLVTTFPEIDPYRDQRREPAVGPMVPPPGPMPSVAAPRWFAYLSAEREDLEEVLGDLAGTGIPGEAYVRGAPGPVVAGARARGVRVHDAPVPVEEMLARTSVVVHAGGAGLTCAALAAGRPQVFLPEHLEQRLTAGLVSNLGVGISAVGRESAGMCVRRVLKGEIYSLDSRELSGDLARRGPWKAVDRVMLVCDESLAR